MKRITIRLAVFCMLLMGTAVQAQWTGTRIGPKPADVPDNNMSDEDKSRFVMRKFAKCVLGVSSQRVIDYLNTFPGSPEALKLATSLSRNDCLVSDTLRFEEKLFRWTAYDELYGTEFSKFDVSSISSIPATDYVAQAQGKGRKELETLALWELGECTVRAAPVEARTLVLSNIASKDETAGFKAIVPFVGGCVVEGNDIKFSKAVLRGVMAEALFKLASQAALLAATGDKK